MKDLVERVEKATGADQWIDAAVYCLAWCPESHPHDEQPSGSDKLRIVQPNGYETYPDWDHSSSYTSSLDAVIALVEREMPEQTAAWSVREMLGARIYIATCDLEETAGNTPALALLLAFLRAREQT